MAEVFPIPRLPHCRLCSFPCISLLISLRLQCLSHYEIFIFSIPLAYGSGSLLQSFERNLNLLNTSTVGLCLGSIIGDWRVLTVLWDLSAASWGPTVHSGDSSEDTEPFSAAQPGCQWHKPCSTAGCFGATLPVNSHPRGRKNFPSQTAQSIASGVGNSFGECSQTLVTFKISESKGPFLHVAQCSPPGEQEPMMDLSFLTCWLGMLCGGKGFALTGGLTAKPHLGPVSLVQMGDVKKTRSN